ncbi:TIGR02285 family protein [Dongshaea marina]|uniref:TIGR02285 family protein n=1 Tax=Dongshaea marina TaxID=2047966 RepID=UPI00131F01E8|nr:TIGR02285 family protein [Dongshaea marina]
MQRLTLLLLVGALFLPGASISGPREKPIIQWVDIILPPFHHIESGPWQGQGITDNIIALMKHKLPEFQQQHEILSGELAIRWLKQKPNVCVAAFKKTADRQSYLYFSLPSVFVPPNGIWVRRQEVSQFGESPVSLGKLIEQGELRLGFDETRSYGSGIDTLLSKYQKQDNLYGISTLNSSERLLKMMSRRRIDYALGYPLELGFLSESMQMPQAFRFLPLRETGNYSFSHIACSRTPQGKRIIAAINRVLLSERPTAHYRSFTERWLDVAILPEYWSDYRTEFANAP